MIGNKKIKLLLAMAISVSPLVNQMPVLAIETAKTDIENLSGVSKEQMQKDFREYASAHQVQFDEEAEVVRNTEDNKNQFIYLSDVNYDTSSQTGWGSIRKDTDVDGNPISLLFDGEISTFQKGMGIHAPSNLIYDIKAHKNTYTNLSTYVGINHKVHSQSDGIEFVFYGSNDKNSWTQLKDKYVLRPKDDAKYVNLDVSKYDYIKLTTNPVGHNHGDHGVYADLRLTKSGYDITTEHYKGVKTVAEYDAEISKYSVSHNYLYNKMLVLQREFVNRIGYQAIQNTYRVNPNGVIKTLDWLFRDLENIQLFIEAGDYFSGNGQNAFNALVSLYTKFEGDMHHKTYKKMLLATAAGYSKDVHIFLFNYGGERIKTDPQKKYEYFKKLYNDGRFIRKAEFDAYPMELVRAVMDAKISDEEIFWLRDHIDKKYPYAQHKDNYRRYNGYGYSHYDRPDWSRTDFYSPENKAKWDQKYDFTRYGIDYGHKNRFRLWMLMEQGSICWGLSGLGMVVNEVQGIPAIGTYQPEHEAYLLYKQNSDGKGVWSLSDDVFGWQNSYTRWGNGIHSEHRMLLSWGNKEYNVLDRGNNTSYIVLGQDALNHYDAYLKSMYYVLIANSYAKTDARHKEALETSLSHYDKNVDAFYELIKTYQANKVSDNEWLQLADRIAKVYRFFPAPMVDFIKLIKEKLPQKHALYLDLVSYSSLKKAVKANDKDTTQPEVSRAVATDILEKQYKEVLTFSFDGEHANKVIFGEQYTGNDRMIQVSLDGGRTWETNQGNNNQTAQFVLSDSQIKRINANQDILVRIEGVDELYRIDIENGKRITNTIYKNDDENVLLGDIEGLEYSMDNGKSWKHYEGGIHSDYPITGRVTVKFRYQATKNHLPGPVDQYTFNHEGDSATSKYVKLKHVSVHEFSSQDDEVHDLLAKNFIDGDANTYWHTKYNQYDKKFFSVKFDKVRYINKLTYLPSNKEVNGRLKSGNIYTSMNGKDWQLVHRFKGLGNDSGWKTINLGQSYETRFIKIEATENYGKTTLDGQMYFSGSMLNFYEDTTKRYVDTVSIDYSTTGSTRFDVTAKLVLPNGYRPVGASQHVFKDNGKVQFAYQDLDNHLHNIEAKVDWIDRVAPTATLKYSTTEKTSGNVVATLEGISEKVYGPTSHTFTENGSYAFIIQDAAGNQRIIVATVDWIDKIGPIIQNTNQVIGGFINGALSGILGR